MASNPQTAAADSDDDEIPRLSAHTLAALASFRAEQEQRLKEEDLQQSTQLDVPDNFEEDWNLSQFWVEVLLLFHLDYAPLMQYSPCSTMRKRRI